MQQNKWVLWSNCSEDYEWRLREVVCFLLSNARLHHTCMLAVHFRFYGQQASKGFAWRVSHVSAERCKHAPLICLTNTNILNITCAQQYAFSNVKSCAVITHYPICSVCVYTSDTSITHVFPKDSMHKRKIQSRNYYASWQTIHCMRMQCRRFSQRTSQESYQVWFTFFGLALKVIYRIECAFWPTYQY